MSRRRWRSLAAGVLLAVAVGAPGSTSPPAKAATGARGNGTPELRLTSTVSLTPPGADETVREFSCIDRDVCVAVGFDVDAPSPVGAGIVYRTTDGGATWTKPTLPGGIAGLFDVDCSPAGNCIAVSGFGVAMSADAGATWSPRVASPPGAFRNPLEEYDDVVCPAASTCYLAGEVDGLDGDSTIMRTTDGGASWTVVDTFLPADTEVVELECVDATHCLMSTTGVGNAAARFKRTADGGATWQTVVLPPDGQAQLQGCSATACFARADAAIGMWRSPDAGVTWSAVGATPARVDCSGMRCVSGLGEISTDGGETWTATDVAPFGVYGIDCPANDVCFSRDAGVESGRLFRHDLVERPVVSMRPARLLETRTGAGFTTVDGVTQGTGRVPAGGVVELPVAGRGGVAAAASMLFANVTVTGPAGPGFVTAYPCGADRPTASSINFVGGETVANGVAIRVGAGGSVCLYAHVETDLVVDVTAYVPSGVPSIVPLVPARLLETRAGPGFTTADGRFQGIGRLAAGGVVELPVHGRSGVGADASMVFANVTVTDPGGPGFVTVYPCGVQPPTASSLNFAAGETVANGVGVEVGVGGRICLYSLVETDLVVDVGAYAPTSVPSVVSVVPARLLETRRGPTFTTVDGVYQGLGFDGASVNPETDFATTYQMAGRGGVPDDADTVMLNVTVTEPIAAGFLTIYSCAGDRPTASSINFVSGQTVANSVVVRVGTFRSVCIYNSAGTHIVVDVTGYTL